MKTKHTIKIFALLLLTALMGVSVTVWAEDVTPSVTLTTYYSAANGKTSDALRTALQGIIDNHTVVSYNSLGTLMQYSDTEEANGTDVIDIYTTCTYSVTGALTWIGSGDVGDGMNREHTAPQSWFNEATPMVSDAFHIFPTDAKANNNRSSYLYGEFSGTGRSYSTSKCTESGKLSNGDSGKKTITSYTYQGTTYSPTASYTGIVYEPADEYKGDIARGYFYLATRYADKCSSWSGGAFGSDNNGFNNYTAELMLKWHRQDPVSRKELIRNEVIYGNTKYNKSDKKQGNRNPFIDYPELVEYIWGNKKGQNVTITALTSAYDEAGSGTPTTTYNVTLWRNGNTQVVSGLSSTYTLPTTGEDDACANWVFDGWSTTNVTSTNTKPNYVTSVSSASTVYAVYVKTAQASSTPVRKAAAAVGETLWAEDFSGFSADDVPTSSKGGSPTVYGGGSVTYSVTDGGGTTKIYDATLAGGSSPELLIAKNGGSFSVSGIPTGDATAMTLTFKTNQTGNLSVTSETTGITVGTLSISSGTATCEITATAGVTNLDLTITKSSSGNSREDDFLLVVKTAGSGGGSTSTTTYASEPEECKCSGNLDTPAVTATPSDGTITLTWPDVTDATNGYTVTISKGVGYTTECGDTEIGEVTRSNGTNTCVITGLVNGLSYTTSVVANATATICESTADEDTTTPVGCSSWDVTFGYSTYSLTAGGTTVAPTITGTTHGAVTYLSSNEAVLTVNGSGIVTPVGAGTATVTASWAGADGYCAKDIVSDLFTVTGSLTITYNANYGETPATATQTVTYNVAATLAANTFSRTGYTFVGWATEPNGDKVYDDQQASVVFTEATTLYAVWQINSHNVTFTPAPTGATVTVNSKSTSPVSNVNYGTTVTIDVTPAAHYSLNTVSVSGTSGSVAVSGTDNARTFTMPDEDVTVTVTMTEDAQYVVNWYVAGTPTQETNYAGETLTGVDAPAIECNGKVFMGWTATADYNSDDAPADLFTDAGSKTMPVNGTNYYAVFAEETVGTSTLTNNYKKITAESELTNGNYLIVAESSNHLAMSTTWKDTYYLDSEVVSPNASDVITDVTDGTIIWNIAVANSQVSIQNATSGYLYIEKSGNYYNIKLGDNTTANKFTYGVTSGNWLFTSVTYSDRVLEYYTTKSRWTFHTAADAPVYLYKQQYTSSTTYIGYTTSCEAPEEVTITFNANEGTGTMEAQTILYNSETALYANTFTREGYSFAGWAISATGAKVYDDKEIVSLAMNTTLYALWTKNSYQVNFTPTMEGQATITINGNSTTPQSVEFGSMVSITITPEDAYTVSGVTVSGGVTPTGSGNSWSFLMPAKDVTVTVTMSAKPTYTIRFFNNGTQIGADQTVVQGQQAVKPSDPTPCTDDYSFVGWWTSTLAEDNDKVQTWITDFTATRNQDYYAVFSYSNGESAGGGSTDVVFNFGYADDWGESSSWSGTDKSSVTATKDGVTVTHTRGSGSIYANATATRFYKDNTLTFEVSGNTITSIVFTCSTYQTDITSNVGTCTATSSEFSWAGDASSVSFSRPSNASSYAQFSSATITVGGSSSATYYTTAPVCDACLNTITLTKGTPVHGTFTLDKDNGEYENCKSSGFVVTVSGITPDEDYEFDAITQSGINEGVTIDQDAKTVTYAQNVNGASTINVTFKLKPTYTIRFFNNGTQIGADQTVVQGQQAVKPSDPTPCADDYTFVGWWTSTLAEDNDEVHTWITDFTATQNQDYYAVFSYSEDGGSGSIESTNAVYNASDLFSNGEEAGSKTIDGVTFAFAKGTNNSNAPKYYSTGTSVRMYANNTLTISSTSTISAISFSFGSTTTAGLTADKDTYSDGSWSGSETEIVFTVGSSGQQHIQSITVTIGAASTTYYTTAPDCTISEVTTNVMLVTVVDGATIAVKPVVSNNQAAAAPLLYVNEKYYRTSAISSAADITWQLVERKGTYYIKDASGNYLTVDGENLSLATEPFTWFTSEGRFVTQSGSGLCYSATERAFVVSSDASASIQQMAVISLEGEAQLFTREFTQVDYYATLCLPYAVAPPFIEGVTVYNVVGRNEKDGKIIGIVLAEETGILNAGQPYVILSTTAELNVWFAADMDMVDKAVETVGLVGNLSEEKLTVPIGCYGLKDNQLRRVVSGSPTVSQYKAYFDLSKVPNADTLPMSPSYKTMRTDADDVETAIDDLFGNPATINWNEPVYNVLGQRVGKDAVGVLIQNGMKFLIP